MSTYQDLFYLQLHDRRLPQHRRQSCQDCARYALRDKICTFSTEYFVGSHTTGHDLTCPFQTETRRTERYDFPDTHSGEWYTNNNLLYTTDPATNKVPRCSSFECEKGHTTTGYDTTVWFLDDETYEYPYCKTDHIYFDYTQLDDHNSTYDGGFTCPLYEHTKVNYKQCEPNLAGFISPTAKDTNTEVPVGNDRKYYSKMEMDPMGEYTGITLE